jgi:hypothetical protein
MYQKCVECPFHKVIADPDPSDWFNVDDEAIVCTKMKNEKIDLASKYSADRNEYKPIDVGLRPYQTKHIDAPLWCPISKANKRDVNIDKILN